MLNYESHLTSPGAVIRLAYLKPSGLSEEELADLLGVNHSQLENILYGESKITPELAISLSQIFGTYVEYWWALQDRMDVGTEIDSEKKCV